MKQIRILIVDDHPVVRAGLQGMLASQKDLLVIAEACNGKEALLRIEQQCPDVALIDLRMPEMDGLTLIRTLKQQHPTISVLVLTTYDSDSDLLLAIEAGAIGYLLKDAPSEDLFRAIRAAVEGKAVLAPSMATLLIERMRTPVTAILSVREIEVLRLVSQGINNKEIANRLYVSEATIKTHLTHIYTKLDVDDRTAAVIVAVKRGLLSL
jgi:DNA-binding NarL/FixJ family response regulator